jgi:hypothetical protein
VKGFLWLASSLFPSGEEEHRPSEGLHCARRKEPFYRLAFFFCRTFFFSLTTLLLVIFFYFFHYASKQDVLCGRGGLSNHHPGNEWYRRLVRSNRPLYRACPKHTKLLVSKAIVQAVEQQKGRFLERNRKTGFWYPVSYKKAVDKTSQGLREKDAEERELERQGFKLGQQPSRPPTLTHVPDNFKGTVKNPNLSDLAEVAIAHARRMGPPPPGYPVWQGSPPPAAAGFHPHPAGAMPNHLPPQTGARAKPAPGQPEGVPVTKQEKRKETTSTTTSEVEQPATKKAKTADENIKPAASPAPSDDLAPLPPDMVPRESSMFRLIRHTHLLPGQSTTVGTAEREGGKAAAEKDEDKKESPSTAESSSSPGQPPSFPPYPYYGGPPPLFAQMPGQMPPSLGPAGLSGYGYSQHPGAPGVPGFTRLTSQVSDWMTKFWPVQPGPARRDPRPSRQEAIMQAKAITASIPPPGDNPYWNAELYGPKRRRKFHLPSPGNKPAATQQQDPVAAAQRASVSAQQEAAAAEPKKLPPPKPKPKTPTSKRKSYSMLPELPYEDGTGEPVATQYEMDISSMPTELEQSVSTTLLKLAGTPSRLFSGLSSLFDRTETSTAPHSPGDEAPGITQDDSTEGGSKKSSKDLLDDTEDTPMEARLRTVTWK